MDGSACIEALRGAAPAVSAYRHDNEGFEQSPAVDVAPTQQHTPPKRSGTHAQESVPQPGGHHNRRRRPRASFDQKPHDETLRGTSW